MKKKHAELLKAILATADLSELPEHLRNEATEAIAEIGGCAFCGRAATRLCDFGLGVEIDEKHTKWPAAKVDAEYFTCDAPLCEQCATKRGWSTISGVPEAYDWCPFHLHVHEKLRPMTKHEAERLRIGRA